MAERHYLDKRETRDPKKREQALFKALPETISVAMKKAPGWAAHLKGIKPKEITDRDALANLPVLRKDELRERQATNPPLGGFIIGTPKDWGRIFMSPGPIFEPQGLSSDPWRGARALFAAGFRENDVVHNAFAYHLTPGGFILDCGARALGCAVIAAGVGNTETQIEAISLLQPTGYAGTSDFLKILLDKAGQSGKDVSSIKRAAVSGSAMPESLRAVLKSHGIDAYQCYATADVGVIAYETEALEGMVVEEDVIIEIVRPGTGEPVAEGEVGEVVVTNFNPVYPMIRFGTGDLSAMLDGRSPCGRTNMRIKGWMGRADQTTKVKGMFVHPTQVAEIGRRHPELIRLRLVVERENEQDVMTLRAECKNGGGDLAAKVAESLQAATKLKGRVEFATPGSLPNDGKVIADERDYG